MFIDSAMAAMASAFDMGYQMLNAGFTIALLGGLTGAIGGALGAQHIVERSQRRKEGLRQLRYTNASIMVAFAICNSAFALKKQHVQPMREEYLKSKADLQSFMARREAKDVSVGMEFHLVMSLKTYPAPIVPLESLKHMVFQELSVVGRPLALVAVIEQSLMGLTAAIAKRDLLIQKFQSGEISEREHVQYYFGLPLSDGHVNEEYSDLVDAIYSYTDDLAFFASRLCLDLMKHGQQVKDALTKFTSQKMLNVSQVDFSSPEKSGLMPPCSQYADWLSAIVENPQQ